MLLLEPEQKTTLDNEVAPALQQAQAMTITQPEHRENAVGFVRALRELKTKIEDRFKPTANREKAYEIWKDLKETENAFYVPIDQAIELITKKVKGYDTAEAKRIQDEADRRERERIQREKEERAKREAEEKAAIEAEERRQLEEFEKLQKEKAEKEALQQQATASGNAKVAGIAAKEVAKLDTKIEEVKAEGEQKIAEIKAKTEEALPAIPRPVPPPALAPKKLIWKARVKNPLLACRSVSEGLIPFNAVDFKVSALNDLAKNYDGVSQIPGIEFYQETSGRI
jgi:hypothetical protein